MNETTIIASAPSCEKQSTEESNQIRELLTVELPYVGGGMANFSFA